MNRPGGKLTPYLCGDSIWKSPNYVIMSLGIGGCVHFKSPPWVCLWNKRRKRTLQVINPFNSPTPAPHATADNTAVTQKQAEEGKNAGGLLYRSSPLKYIHKWQTCHSSEAWGALGKSIPPSFSVVRGRLSYVAAIIGLCTVQGIWQNKWPYNG